MLSHGIFKTVSLVLLFLMFVPATLCADPPPGKGKGGKKDPDAGVSTHFDAGIEASAGVSVGASIGASIGAGIDVGITVGDARRLATRYELTGAKPLPPGIAKNLARGKPLPPGIAKKQLPGPFIHDLPHHEGYEWKRVGRDLVLVAIGTLIVAEILEHVFD